MPHIFKIDCYRKYIEQKKAKIGDVVYLKARPDVPMSVTETVHYNSAASIMGDVRTRWMAPDGSIREGEFKAEELSL